MRPNFQRYVLHVYLLVLSRTKDTQRAHCSVGVVLQSLVGNLRNSLIEAGYTEKEIIMMSTNSGKGTRENDLLDIVDMYIPI